MPLLDPKHLSHFSSVNLRNPPEFPDPLEYAGEYTLVREPGLLARVYRALLSPTSPAFTNQTPYILAEYLNWAQIPTPPKGKKPDVSSVDREWFEKLLYAMSQKLALPFPRKTFSWTLIYSPFNLATYFKFLEHLCSSGFPAHRLSDAVGAILDDNVVTSARAPRSNPVRAEELEKELPRHRINVRPFFADFSTVAAIWQSVLPFGIAHLSLPSLHNVGRFEAKLGPLIGGDLNVPHSALLFWDRAVAQLPRTSLRKILSDDEKGDRSEQAAKIRHHGVHVLTTSNWSSKTSIAGFWIRKDIIDEMQRKGNWHLYFMRTDIWVPVTNGLQVSTLRSTRSWTDS